jgi:predicted PurR-regulated permease PerM
VAAEQTSGAQRVARYILLSALLLLGVWMLREFLPALCWAVVVAIATSRLYDRWLARFRGRHRHEWAAASFTTLIGIVLIVPLAYVGILAGHEAYTLFRSFVESSHNGPPELPQWLAQLPFVGEWLQGVLSDTFSRAAHESSKLTEARPAVFELSRVLGLQLLRRLTTLVFTLLTLFFVYLNRDSLSADVPRVSRLVFGGRVDELLQRAVDAIRAAVDGIVLVAVAEGAIMGVTYALTGVPHPLLLGVATGVFAMVPFAAPIVFGAVAIGIGVQGSIGHAIGIAVTGSIMLFVADHFVRPAIIGGSARLPFLWVLLGILGGIGSFGLVGLFVGPALMAALLSIWRTAVAGLPPARDR